ncbi:MAG: GNVR domain-containing protein, partial [Acidobacteriaceae bacterium]
SGANLEKKLTFVLDDSSLLEDDENAHDLPDFLRLATALALRKRFIAKLTLSALLIGSVAAFLLPNRYTATVKILPPQQTQSSAAALLTSLSGSGIGSLASAAGKDLGIKNPNDLYVGMLKTRPVADALIQRFDLRTEYKSKDMTAARAELADQTSIVSGKEGFISVSVVDKQKKRAAEIANSYIQELRNMTQRLALTEASQQRLFYEQQLKQAKDELANAEIDLKLAQQKSGVIQLDAQAKSIIEEIGQARALIAAKRVEVQSLRSFATDGNPDVQLAQHELSAMQAELSRLEKQSGAPDSYEVALKDVPAAAVEYVRKMRELKYRETLYELLAKQYEMARLDEAKTAAVIQVVEPATEPDRKSSPQRTLFVLLSAMAGCFVACLLVLAQTWRERVNADPQRSQQLAAFRIAVMGK